MRATDAHRFTCVKISAFLVRNEKIGTQFEEVVSCTVLSPPHPWCTAELIDGWPLVKRFLSKIVWRDWP